MSKRHRLQAALIDARNRWHDALRAAYGDQAGAMHGTPESKRLPEFEVYRQAYMAKAEYWGESELPRLFAEV